MDHPGQAGGTDTVRSEAQIMAKDIDLGAKADQLAITKPDLRESIANQVLVLFRYSLLGTLSFSAVILAADLAFIALKIISPADRLMTETVLMTLIGATVVQVGAALAAIVYAVFKAPAQTDD